MKNFIVVITGYFFVLSAWSQNRLIDEVVMSPQERFAYLARRNPAVIDSGLLLGWVPLRCDGWQLNQLIFPFDTPRPAWGALTNAEVQDNWNRAGDPECLVTSLADLTGVPRWLPPNFSEQYLAIARVSYLRVFEGRPVITISVGDVEVRVSYPDHSISITKCKRAILASALSNSQMRKILQTIVDEHPHYVEEHGLKVILHTLKVP